MTIILYVIAVASILGLVFIAGYMVGNNKAPRIEDIIKRLCIHDFENVFGVLICKRCGYMRKE